MNNSTIDNLLEKYWLGETSLNEESQLRTFFQNEQLDDKYEALRPLFVGEPIKEMPKISSAAEAKWMKTFDQLDDSAKREAKVVGMQPKRNWLKVAAVAAVLVLAGMFLYDAITQKEYEEEQMALEAYEETKRALAMVGIHFENGKDKTAIGINQVSKNLDILNR